MLKMLPLAWLAGLRLQQINEQSCHIGLRYGWINQNPFRSIYFAALAMAAEMSTGLPALRYIRQQKYNCAMLVTRLEADFHKKAVGRIRFQFDEVAALQQCIALAIANKQAVSYTACSNGYDEQNNLVAVMHIHWGFKSRA